jgi:uncharacterized protein (DUF1330 family)
MAAYFLVDILEVKDAPEFEEYKKRVGAVVERFGGRYRIVGGNPQIAEGNWRPTFPVLIEFPSLAEARRWYDSEDYRELKEMRFASARANALFLEGL